MPIVFLPERWNKIRKDYSDWWDGTLERPLIHIELTGMDPLSPRPEEEIFYPLTARYDFSTPVDVIIKHWDYILSSKNYIGDAYPNILPDFGAGVNAAFIGAKKTIAPDTVWFEPPGKVPMDRLHFKYDPDEPWFSRIREIYKRASKYFGGSVCLGMTHLNNGIDPVARFFDSVEFNLSFYTDPENLKRLIWENHELCFRYFDDFNKIIGQTNPGNTCWGYIFSAEPHFIWQSDYCVMIGPDMFKEFILPEINECCRKVKNSFYHLDGPGELKHLDAILGIKELRGVQWIPGAGQPDEKYWPEVYREIKKAGKLIQLFGDLDTLDAVSGQLGSAKGLYYWGSFDISEEEKVIRILKKFKAV